MSSLKKKLIVQTRYAFARLVNVMGENILGKIPPLIGGLLRKSTTWELIDFLPFLGQLIHKFKPTIQTFLDELMLPLISRIFESLNKPVEGTDDVIEQTSMRKAYLSFIMTLFNNRMESIFVSQASRSKFDAVLESIIHYATDTSDATVEKVAFGVLNKMVVVWSTPSSEPDPLEKEFHEAFGQFVIQHLSRVCFEVPSKTSFNSNDAQSRLVLAEIAGLQKSIFQMKGDLFVSYLQNSFFPSLGVSPEAAGEYVRALQQLDLKQFKKFFVVCSYFCFVLMCSPLQVGDILAFREHLSRPWIAFWRLYHKSLIGQCQIIIKHLFLKCEYKLHFCQQTGISDI